jgi:ATP-binding cassette, subfamily B, multidrug efflux pump
MTHLRRLAPYVWRHRRQLAIGLVYLLITVAFASASPWVLRVAIDDLTLRLTRASLWYYALAVVALVACEGLFRYGTRMTLIGVSRDIEYELRQDLFRHLTRLAPAYYHSHRIGDLMSRATNDVAAVRMVLGPGIMYSANTAATFVATLVLMTALSPALLAAAVLPLLVVAWVVARYGRGIHDRSQEVQAQLAHLSAMVQENLAGVRVLRAYVQEPAEKRRFAEANEEYMRRSRRLILLAGGLHPFVITLLGLGAVLVLWLGGRMVAANQISLGAFVAFMVYLGMLHWPTIAIGWVTNIVERGEASMGRCLEVLDAPVEILSVDDASALAVRGDVELRRLSFSYSAGPPVLHDIDLRVPAGTSVAIVGPTGSGKSSLVGLLARLHDPPAGTLFVDGRDIRELPLAGLRRALGFVPQEAFLFSDTLRANVAFGADASDGREARVEWAVETAQLAKDVRDFPQRYETKIGERGITLSGGQKQRTALARALVRDPRILILDDALAAVDAQTEEQILLALKAFARGHTTFIVSHRVSAVSWADQIVVLRGGQIVERGSHEELISEDGYYADLYRRQLLEKEMAEA